MADYFMLFLGVLCAGFGGELFLRGTVGLARGLRVAPAIIGATLAAFATSSPELAVGISAALAGKPQIALGDILGSNIVNVALILGLSLCFSGIQTSRSSMRRDFPVVLLISVLIGVFLLDGRLSRFEGVLLLALFMVWFAANVAEALRQRKDQRDLVYSERLGRKILLALLGLGFLMLSGQLIVTGAKSIAVALGVNEFIIGATIVALGTSAPELATVLIAKLRGHDEVGLGTILGSNIFNSLLIVAVAALITPIEVALREVLTALGFGMLSAALIYPDRTGWIGRWRGMLLLMVYALYLAFTIAAAG